METDTHTVLCVDDEPGVLIYLEIKLRRLGLNVLCAESWSEASRCLSSNDINMVISDLKLPDMDGDELLSNIAATWPHITRVLMTGSAPYYSEKAVGKQFPVQHLLSKPWSEEDLAHIVASMKDSI